MFGLGTTELLIILVLFAAIFGLGKLPRVAKQLGLGVRNFKDSMDGKDTEETQDAAQLEDKSATQATREASMPRQETGEPDKSW